MFALTSIYSHTILLFTHSNKDSLTSVLCNKETNNYLPTCSYEHGRRVPWQNKFLFKKI